MNLISLKEIIQRKIKNCEEKIDIVELYNMRSHLPDINGVNDNSDDVKSLIVQRMDLIFNDQEC